MNRRWKGETPGDTAVCLQQQRRRASIAMPLLLLALIFATCCHHEDSAYAQEPAPPPLENSQSPQQPAYAEQTPEQLQQLVAPIALYPDSLVAQILAASTYPEQVVEADRFVQAHPDLKGDALAQAVNQQPWDASVKAVTAFPDVLGNMDKNLSWTSSLGDAYYNQGQAVMDAIQVMRQRAEQAGTLKSTPQETVTTQDSNIVIQPASPTVVYVPAYDPWLVYGGPLPPWPGWYPYPGIWFGGPYISFGIGFNIGFFGGYGWGWPHWGCNWHYHYAVFNHGRYISHSRVLYNRANFYRGGMRGVGVRPFNGNARAPRGFAAPRGQAGVRSGAFNGGRGQTSFGGGHGVALVAATAVALVVAMAAALVVAMAAALVAGAVVDIGNQRLKFIRTEWRAVKYLIPEPTACIA